MTNKLLYFLSCSLLLFFLTSSKVIAQNETSNTPEWWQTLGLKGLDIAQSSNDDLWVVGLDGRAYRFNPERSIWIPWGNLQNLVRIDVAPSGWAVSIDASGNTFLSPVDSSGRWQALNISASDVGIANDTIWLTGLDGIIYRSITDDNGQLSFETIRLFASRISALDERTAYALDPSGSVIKIEGNDATQVDNLPNASDIAVGSEGSIYLTALNFHDVSAGFNVYQYSLKSGVLSTLDSELIAITAGADDVLYGLNQFQWVVDNPGSAKSNQNQLFTFQDILGESLTLPAGLGRAQVSLSAQGELLVGETTLNGKQTKVAIAQTSGMRHPNIFFMHKRFELSEYIPDIEKTAFAEVSKFGDAVFSIIPTANTLIALPNETQIAINAYFDTQHNFALQENGNYALYAQADLNNLPDGALFAQLMQMSSTSIVVNSALQSSMFNNVSYRDTPASAFVEEGDRSLETLKQYYGDFIVDGLDLYGISDNLIGENIAGLQIIDAQWAIKLSSAPAVGVYVDAEINLDKQLVNDYSLASTISLSNLRLALDPLANKKLNISGLVSAEQANGAHQFTDINLRALDFSAEYYLPSAEGSQANNTLLMTGLADFSSAVDPSISRELAVLVELEMDASSKEVTPNIVIDTGLYLADLTGLDIPVVNQLALTQVRYSPAIVSANAQIGSDDIVIARYEPPSYQAPLFLFSQNALRLEAYIPELSNTPFSGALMNNASVFARGQGVDTLTFASTEDLPEFIKNGFSANSQLFPLEIPPGVTAIGEYVLSQNADKSELNALGVQSNSYFGKAFFDLAFLAEMDFDAIDNPARFSTFLTNFNFDIELFVGAFDIPGYENIIKAQAMSAQFSRENQQFYSGLVGTIDLLIPQEGSDTEPFTLSTSGKIQVTEQAENITLQIAASTAFTQVDASALSYQAINDITVLSAQASDKSKNMATQNAWKSAFGIDMLSVNQLAFVSRLDLASESKTLKLDTWLDANLGSEPIDAIGSILLEEDTQKNVSLNALDFSIPGPILVGGLPRMSEIPSVSQWQFKDMQLTLDSLSAKFDWTQENMQGRALLKELPKVSETEIEAGRASEQGIMSDYELYVAFSKFKADMLYPDQLPMQLGQLESAETVLAFRTTDAFSSDILSLGPKVADLFSGLIQQGSFDYDSQIDLVKGVSWFSSTELSKLPDNTNTAFLKQVLTKELGINEPIIFYGTATAQENALLVDASLQIKSYGLPGVSREFVNFKDTIINLNNLDDSNTLKITSLGEVSHPDTNAMLALNGEINVTQHAVGHLQYKANLKTEQTWENPLGIPRLKFGKMEVQMDLEENAQTNTGRLAYNICGLGEYQQTKDTESLVGGYNCVEFEPMDLTLPINVENVNPSLDGAILSITFTDQLNIPLNVLSIMPSLSALDGSALANLYLAQKEITETPAYQSIDQFLDNAHFGLRKIYLSQSAASFDGELKLNEFLLSGRATFLSNDVPLNNIAVAGSTVKKQSFFMRTDRSVELAKLLPKLSPYADFDIPQGMFIISNQSIEELGLSDIPDEIYQDLFTGLVDADLAKYLNVEAGISFVSKIVSRDFPSFVQQDLLDYFSATEPILVGGRIEGLFTPEVQSGSDITPLRLSGFSQIQGVAIPTFAMNFIDINDLDTSLFFDVKLSDIEQKIPPTVKLLAKIKDSTIEQGSDFKLNLYNSQLDLGISNELALFIDTEARLLLNRSTNQSDENAQANIQFTGTMQYNNTFADPTKKEFTANLKTQGSWNEPLQIPNLQLSQFSLEIQRQQAADTNVNDLKICGDMLYRVSTTPVDATGCIAVGARDKYIAEVLFNQPLSIQLAEFLKLAQLDTSNGVWQNTLLKSANDSKVTFNQLYFSRNALVDTTSDDALASSHTMAFKGSVDLLGLRYDGFVSLINKNGADAFLLRSNSPINLRALMPNNIEAQGFELPQSVLSIADGKLADFSLNNMPQYLADNLFKGILNSQQADFVSVDSGLGIVARPSPEQLPLKIKDALKPFLNQEQTVLLSGTFNGFFTEPLEDDVINLLAAVDQIDLPVLPKGLFELKDISAEVQVSVPRFQEPSVKAIARLPKFSPPQIPPSLVSFFDTTIDLSLSDENSVLINTQANIKLPETSQRLVVVGALGFELIGNDQVLELALSSDQTWSEPLGIPSISFGELENNIAYQKINNQENLKLEYCGAGSIKINTSIHAGKGCVDLAFDITSGRSSSKDTVLSIEFLDQNGDPEDLSIPLTDMLVGMTDLLVQSAQEAGGDEQENKSVSLGDMGIPDTTVLLSKLYIAKDTFGFDGGLSIANKALSGSGFFVNKENNLALFMRNDNPFKPSDWLPSELVPDQDFAVPRSVFTFSSKAFPNFELDSIPDKINKTLFANILSLETSQKLRVEEGIGFVMKTTTNVFPAPVRTVVDDVFNLDSEFILGGSLGGISGGEKSASLYTEFTGFSLPELPADIIKVNDSDLRLFVKKVVGASVIVGLDTSAEIKVPKLDEPGKTDTVDTTLSLEYDLANVGAPFSLNATVNGTWVNPFGFDDTTVNDTTISIGPAASGIRIGIDTENANFKGRRFHLTLDTVWAGGVPTQLALLFGKPSDAPDLYITPVIQAEIYANILKLGFAGGSSILDNATSLALKELEQLNMQNANVVKDNVVRGIQALSNAANASSDGADSLSGLLKNSPLAMVAIKNPQIYFATPGNALPAKDGIERPPLGLGLFAQGSLILDLGPYETEMASGISKVNLLEGVYVSGRIDGKTPFNGTSLTVTGNQPLFGLIPSISMKGTITAPGFQMLEFPALISGDFNFSKPVTSATVNMSGDVNIAGGAVSRSFSGSISPTRFEVNSSPDGCIDIPVRVGVGLTINPASPWSIIHPDILINNGIYPAPPDVVGCLGELGEQLAKAGEKLGEAGAYVGGKGLEYGQQGFTFVMGGASAALGLAGPLGSELGKALAAATQITNESLNAIRSGNVIAIGATVGAALSNLGSAFADFFSGGLFDDDDPPPTYPPHPQACKDDFYFNQTFKQCFHKNMMVFEHTGNPGAQPSCLRARGESLDVVRCNGLTDTQFILNDKTQQIKTAPHYWNALASYYPAADTKCMVAENNGQTVDVKLVSCNYSSALPHSDEWTYTANGELVTIVGSQQLCLDTINSAEEGWASMRACNAIGEQANTNPLKWTGSAYFPDYARAYGHGYRGHLKSPHPALHGKCMGPAHRHMEMKDSCGQANNLWRLNYYNDKEVQLVFPDKLDGTAFCMTKHGPELEGGTFEAVGFHCAPVADTQLFHLAPVSNFNNFDHADPGRGPREGAFVVKVPNENLCLQYRNSSKKFDRFGPCQNGALKNFIFEPNSRIRRELREDAERQASEALLAQQAQQIKSGHIEANRTALRFVESGACLAFMSRSQWLATGTQEPINQKASNGNLCPSAYSMNLSEFGAGYRIETSQNRCLTLTPRGNIRMEPCVFTHANQVWQKHIFEGSEGAFALIDAASDQCITFNGSNRPLTMSQCGQASQLLKHEFSIKDPVENTIDISSLQRTELYEQALAMGHSQDVSMQVINLNHEKCLSIEPDEMFYLNGRSELLFKDCQYEYFNALEKENAIRFLDATDTPEPDDVRIFSDQLQLCLGLPINTLVNGEHFVDLPPNEYENKQVGLVASYCQNQKVGQVFKKLPNPTGDGFRLVNNSLITSDIGAPMCINTQASSDSSFAQYPVFASPCTNAADVFSFGEAWLVDEAVSPIIVAAQAPYLTEKPDYSEINVEPTMVKLGFHPRFNGFGKLSILGNGGDSQISGCLVGKQSAEFRFGDDDNESRSRAGRDSCDQNSGRDASIAILNSERNDGTVRVYFENTEVCLTLNEQSDENPQGLWTLDTCEFGNNSQILALTINNANTRRGIPENISFRNMSGSRSIYLNNNNGRALLSRQPGGGGARPSYVFKRTRTSDFNLEFIRTPEAPGDNAAQMNPDVLARARQAAATEFSDEFSMQFELPSGEGICLRVQENDDITKQLRFAKCRDSDQALEAGKAFKVYEAEQEDTFRVHSDAFGQCLTMPIYKQGAELQLFDMRSQQEKEQIKDICLQASEERGNWKKNQLLAGLQVNLLSGYTLTSNQVCDAYSLTPPIILADCQEAHPGQLWSRTAGKLHIDFDNVEYCMDYRIDQEGDELVRSLVGNRCKFNTNTIFGVRPTPRYNLIEPFVHSPAEVPLSFSPVFTGQ